jgi:predicted RND superfamily exporter protein
MANRLHAWAASHASWLLAITAVLTLLAVAQLIDLRTGDVRLTVDPSLEAVSTQNQAEREYAEIIRRRFRNDETVIVVVHVADIFALDSLERIDRLSRRLSQLGGVQAVSSLTATALPQLDNGDLRYRRVRREDLEDITLPDRLRALVADNPLVTGQLVSADGRAAAILVTPEPTSEADMLRSDLAGRIMRLVDAERAAGIDIWVTGTPIIRAGISDTVTRQLKRIVPTIVVVLTALLAIAYPTVRGVLLPIVTIAIALLWTLATLSALGRPLNLITALVPPLLVTMGLAYCAHILSEFEALLRGKGPANPVARVEALLNEVSVPVSITGFTTIAGLLALLLNEQKSLLEFAWLSAVGAAYLVVLTLMFVPAVLRYIDPQTPGRPLPASRAFEAGSERLSRFDQRWRPLILIGAGVVFLAAVFFASRIQVGDAFVGIFSKDARVRADYEAVNAAIGGVNPLDIAVDGGAADVFTDPEVVRALEYLERWLRDQPEVGAVVGLADHVKLLYHYIGGGNGVVIPDSRPAISQLLFAGEGELLRGVVNSDRSSTLIRLRLTVDDTAPIDRFLNRLQTQLDYLPRGLEARVTGNAAVMTNSVKVVTSGQLQSVALALGLIYMCMALQFMSFRVGFLCSLPTLLQTSLYFGALGLIGIPLNPTTLLVECIVLGLAIDDTIHYLSRFNSAAKRSGSETAAAASALKAVLRPVTLTKAILAIGFLTMVTGELRNQAQFGLLAFLTLFSAWLVDAFVTPAFMSGLRIVTLWDTLRLNLGDNVQGTIPLFSGLTNRQARIFALMANLHTLPAGVRLMSEGDDAGDIYVVIDGKLSVSVERNGEKIELTQFKRGDVVGERGYFGQKRTANVDTVTEARLLRFDDADQDRICQAYPAIAARVFLSLNRIQAQRHAERLSHGVDGTVKA